MHQPWQPTVSPFGDGMSLRGAYPLPGQVYGHLGAASLLTSADTSSALAGQVFGRHELFRQATFAYTDAANSFTVSPQTITCDADGHKGLILKGHSATQSANLQEWCKSDGTVIHYVEPLLAGANNYFVIDTAGSGGTGGTVSPGTLAVDGLNHMVAIGGTFPSDRTLYKLWVNGSVSFGGYFYAGSRGVADFMMNSLGTNVATIQNDSADVWSLGTKTAVDTTLGTPCLQWTKTGLITTFLTNAFSGTVSPAVQISRNHSSGTPGANDGESLQWRVDDSTTANSLVAEEQALWASATHASRKGRWTAGAHDAGTSAGSPREGFRVESSGSAAMISFLGAAAVVQQANASQAGITATLDPNAAAALQAIYNLLVAYGLAPATA